MHSSATNIAHLSAGRFKSVEFPIPPLDEQHRIVTAVDERLSVAAALSRTLDEQCRRGATLRSAILTAAMAGDLVAQDPRDEPAAVLEGIAVKGSASNGHRASSAVPDHTKVSK